MVLASRGVFLLFGLFLVPFVFSYSNLRSEDYLYGDLLPLVLFSSVLIMLLVFFCLFYEKKIQRFKKFFFSSLLIIIVFTTVYLVGLTIYLNSLSSSKGPVHWHADFEIYACGERFDLRDPTGFSNRIGTPVFHEHNDQRIHVEGVILDELHVSLSSFFEVIGGTLRSSSFSVPTHESMKTYYNGELCHGIPSELQVFLYRVVNPGQMNNFIYEQQKLDHFEDYVLSPHSLVPPGDCFIIEFGPSREQTDRVCETYRLALERGELRGS